MASGTIPSSRDRGNCKGYFFALPKRKGIIEPIFGQLKHVLGFRQFSLTGLAAMELGVEVDVRGAQSAEAVAAHSSVSCGMIDTASLLKSPVCDRKTVA